MVEITQSEKGHGSDDDFAELHLLYNYSDDDSRQFTRWHMAEAISHGRRITKLATIAALEQPTPEMRKAVALAIEQTRSTIERDIKDKNQQQCAAHALADAALAAAAKCLKEPTQ